MPIKITLPKLSPENILNKFSTILFGIFIECLIFATSIQIFKEIGIYLAIIISIALMIAGIKISKRKSLLRLTTYGMIGTLVLCTSLYFILLFTITKSLEGL